MKTLYGDFMYGDGLYANTTSPAEEDGPGGGSFELEDHGWISEHATLTSTGLTFNSPEIIINQNTLTSSLNTTSVRADFRYNEVDIALILWYNNTGYLRYVLTPNGISVIRHFNGNDIPLKTYIFGTNEIEAPQINDTVTLRVELYRTNVKCYLNDIDQPVFNLEQNTFSEGRFGIYGGAGATCLAFAMKSNAITDWERHTDSGCSIFANERGIQFMCSEENESYVSQTIDTIEGEPYTITVPHEGPIFVSTSSGDQIDSENDNPVILTFQAPSNQTEIRIGMNVAGTATIYTPQVEHREFATTVTLGTRERSTLSFPASQIDRDYGGLAIWVTPMQDYSSVVAIIACYGDEMILRYKEDRFEFCYGEEIAYQPHEFVIGKWYHLIITWSNDRLLTVNVYDPETDENLGGSASISSQYIYSQDYLLIGCDSGGSTSNIKVDTLVVYSGETDYEKMKAYRTEPIPDDRRIVIKTDFSHETLSFSQNRITIPNPKAGTPIFVEDEDGLTYERVYFLDAGKYVTYNKKKVPYDGTKVFKPEYTDLTEIKAYSDTRIYSDVKLEDGLIKVDDLALDDITMSNDSLVMVNATRYRSSNGNWLVTKPISVKRIVTTGVYEELSASDYTIDYENGMVILKASVSYQLVASYSFSNVRELTIQYTPRNVFCAGYNKESNGYEIYVSNVSGKKLTLTYEDIDEATTKFVTMIEGNPFKAANNNGFVYVTGTPIPVTTLDVKITPNALVADGHQIATIMVDCFAENGALTSNADLRVTTTNGTKYCTIERYRSAEETAWLQEYEEYSGFYGEEAALKRYGYFVTDEHISGRYIYKLKANRIAIPGVYTEKITIVDAKTGIGTEVPIKIVSKS